MTRMRTLGSMGLIAALLGGLLLPSAALADRGDRDRGDRHHRRHHVERHPGPQAFYVHPGVRRDLHRPHGYRAHRGHGYRVHALRHGIRAHRHAFCHHGQHGRRACFRGPHGVWCR